MKTLSVVLPNYNHGQYLKYSIPAICEQKRVPDQLIVMDDASTDNSIEILEQYRDKYNPSRTAQCYRQYHRDGRWGNYYPPVSQ